MSGPPDWKVGDALEERTPPPIDRDQLRKYAEASGDPNPIHLSDQPAAAAGLPGDTAPRGPAPAVGGARGRPGTPAPPPAPGGPPRGRASPASSPTACSPSPPWASC